MSWVAWQLMFLLVGAIAHGAELPFFSRVGATIEIEVSSDGMRSLRASPRKDVLARLRVGEKVWDNVPVKLKGTGTFQPADERPSFTLEFPEGKIHLNNSADDASRMNEFVGAYFCGRAGMEVPRVGHGVVGLNGRRLGLYVVKEGFKEARVEAKDLGRVDLRDFAGFVAVEVMLGHWDGYSLRGNNFHAVERDGGVAFLPAGMDQIFGKADFTWKPEMTGPLARAMFASPHGRAVYEQEFRRIFAKAFDAKAMRALVLGRVNDLKPALSGAEFRDLNSEAAELCERIKQREEYLRKALSPALARTDGY